MKYIAYTDRKSDINQALGLFRASKENFLCYRSKSGYGITAFFHRLCYLLQSTNEFVCLMGELSDNSRSPIHEALRKIIIKNGDLYQTIQMYADERHGEFSQSIAKSIIKDLPFPSETILSLAESRKAFPIYTGYYQDVLKNIFFKIIKNELIDKKIIFFIDNIQFIDKSSFYDILSLSEMKNVKIVMSYTETAELTEKMLLEIQNQSELQIIDFDEPPVECVIELWKNESKIISNDDAIKLINNSHGDIRQLVYSAQHGFLPDKPYINPLANEILTLFYILQDNITLSGLKTILSTSPLQSLATNTEIIKTIDALVQAGFISSTSQVNGQNTFNVRIRNDNKNDWEILTSNKADFLLYEDMVYNYLKKKREFTFNELKKLFELSDVIAPQDQQLWGKKLLMFCLQNGTNIIYNWIKPVELLNEPENQFLCAICLYKIFKYSEAIEILRPLYAEYPQNRDVKILFAIVLNRCRKHHEAKEILEELIKTSKNVDEKTLLLSFNVSNEIHSGNESNAKEIVKLYNKELQESSLYGYFLRNSATLFRLDESEKLWTKALKTFKEKGDEYGEITTIVNMAKIYIHKGNPEFAKSQLEYAYKKLMSYGMEHLHIVANNLGIACLCCGEIAESRKYLSVANIITKSIMPKTYITINRCCAYLEENNGPSALEELLNLKNAVEKSNLPRLKNRFLVTLAGLYCICRKYSEATEILGNLTLDQEMKYSKYISNIKKICKEQHLSAIETWRDIVPFAFLEYWVSNPLLIMSPKALSPETFIQNIHN